MTRDFVDSFTFEREENADWSHRDPKQSIEVALADSVKRRQPRTDHGISGRLWTDSVPVFIGPPSDPVEHQEVAQQFEAWEGHVIERPAAARWTV